MGFMRAGLTQGDLVLLGPDGMPAVNGAALTGLKQYSEVLLGLTASVTGFALNQKFIWDIQDPPASLAIDGSGNITLPAGKVYLLEANVGMRNGTWANWAWGGTGVLAIYGGVYPPSITNSDGIASQAMGILPVQVGATSVWLYCGARNGTTTPYAYGASTTARIRIYQP